MTSLPSDGFGNATLTSSDPPLLANECLVSRNGNFSLCLQPTAVLELSDQEGSILWTSGQPADNGAELGRASLTIQVGERDTERG